MKTLVIIALAFICLASGYNLRSRTSYAIEKLNDFAEKSDYAKVLSSYISLHLESGGKVDEVINFVKEANQNAKDNRVALNTLYLSEMARLQEQIDNLEKSIKQMKDDLDTTIAEIKSLRTQINNLTVSIAGLRDTIAAINSRESILQKARNEDLDAFARRQTRDTNAINGLEKIIPALKNLLSGGSALIQKSEEQIKEALKSIPKNDPITRLVQLSTKFNAVKLEEVINKLENILGAIKASKEQDEKSEDASKQKFDELSEEISSSRKKAQKSLDTQVIEQSMAEANKIVAEAKRVSLEDSIKTTTTLRESAISVKESSEISFKKRLGDADQAIEALTAVYNLLTQNESSLQDTEKTSDRLLAGMF